MEESSEKKYRLSLGEIVFLLSLASVADIFTAIPFVGIIVGPLFWIFFSIYFLMTGKGWVNPRVLTPQIISLVAEVFPVIQEFPTIILGVIIIVILVLLEDKTGLKITGKKGLAQSISSGKFKSALGENVKNPRMKAGIKAAQILRQRQINQQTQTKNISPSIQENEKEPS